jgi:hypothetical protein
MEARMTRYRIPEGVLRATVEGEEVLLNQETGEYHLVNATGLSLIRSFEAGDSVKQAIDALADWTGQDRRRVAADATTFIDAMVARGLLETAPGPA